MSKDAWLWYEGKDGEVESDIPDLAELFVEKNVSKILDLGCGTGRHSIYLSAHGFQVSGFDWSENAVKRAKERLEAARVGADLRVWEMQSIPYPYGLGAFDAVITIKVIHHSMFRSIKKIMHEIERVTRSGGYLYVQVPVFEKAARLEKEGLRSQEVEPGTFRPLEGDEQGIPHHYFRKDELLSLLGNYKIVDMNVKCEHYCVTSLKK